ncbi:TetR/AcrR family transcriptional regulator [Polaromonas sp. YR568]|uniref:TetR/AcrR family transcriptional regulator n=1 Tax=Polaromonas sp. YR568 TaxID=1855301 RepID=UPI00398BE988
MARPRQFDEAAVLDAAVQCFWSRGYEVTSVRELAEGMGLTSASLYNAFGDKRALYRRSLEHYLEQSVRDRIRRFEGLAPRDAVAAFLGEIVERSMGDLECRGCMLVNAALEIAPHDPEFRLVVAEELRQIEAFFRRCVGRGQKSGEISATVDAKDAARILLGVLMGIRVLARARPERALLEGIVRPALGLLDPPARPPGQLAH